MEVPPLRWSCKKIARKSMALGSQYSGSLALAGWLSREATVRVLTYHRFGNLSYDPFCVSQEYFTQQMAYLAKHDLAISLEEFEQYLKGELSLSKDSVLVTIDDGFQSLYSIALPILKQFGIPAVAFITPSLIPETGAVNALAKDQPEPYMDWNEIRQLQNNNVTIGSHAWTHRSLGTLGADEIREEAVRSRQALEDELSQPVTSLAYPFGTRADFNNTTVKILEQAGYNCAFTSQHGASRKPFSPYELPRVKVEGGEAMWVFRSLLKGGLDAWRLFDQTLWRLQARDDA